MASNAHGRFHWNELLTNDVEAAKAFYGKAMGWVYDDMKMSEGAYFVAIKGNEPVAGIMAMPAGAPEGTPPHWLSYIEVDDVDASVAQARDAGAQILKEPFDVSEVGRIAIVKDPTGAVCGWITPDFND